MSICSRKWDMDFFQSNVTGLWHGDGRSLEVKFHIMTGSLLNCLRDCWMAHWKRYNTIRRWLFKEIEVWSSERMERCTWAKALGWPAKQWPQNPSIMLVEIGIARSWIIVIPYILGSIIPQLIINQAGFWTLLSCLHSLWFHCCRNVEIKRGVVYPHVAGSWEANPRSGSAVGESQIPPSCSAGDLTHHAMCQSWTVNHIWVGWGQWTESESGQRWSLFQSRRGAHRSPHCADIALPNCNQWR